MSDPTRRGFIATAAVAGAGAAAAGIAAAAPADAAKPTPAVPGASGPIVAYVSDVRTGTLSVMVDEREVVIHDRELVNRLSRAVH